MRATGAVLVAGLMLVGCAPVASHLPDSGLPRFDPQAPDLAGFARKLEVHCGLRAGDLLSADAPRYTLTFETGRSVTYDQFRCVQDGVRATDFGGRAVSILLIGEDAP